MTVRVRIFNDSTPKDSRAWDQELTGGNSVRVDGGGHLLISADSSGFPVAIYAPGAWFSAEVVEKAKRG